MLPPVRHVRCDEERPSCSQCISTGRRCDGYGETPPPGCNSPGVALSPLPNDSSLERRAFAVFRDRASPHLSALDSGAFWHGFVVPLAYRDAVVRRALVALGLFLEDFDLEVDPSRCSDGRLAVRMYNMAIRKHIDALESLGYVESVTDLVPPVVFVCIEVGGTAQC
jgi:hypothetical protein